MSKSPAHLRIDLDAPSVPLQIHLSSPASSEEGAFHLETPYHKYAASFGYGEEDCKDGDLPSSISRIATTLSNATVSDGSSSSSNNKNSDNSKVVIARLQQELTNANIENKGLKEQIELLTKELKNARIYSATNTNENHCNEEKYHRYRADTLSSPLPRVPLKLSASRSDERSSNLLNSLPVYASSSVTPPTPSASSAYVPISRSISQRPLVFGQTDFKAIFEATPNPFCVLDTNSPVFTVVAVNDAYLTATLRERHEVVGKGLFEAFPDNPENENTPAESSSRVSFMRVIATKEKDAMAVQRYDVEEPIGSGNWHSKWWTPINFPVWTAAGKMYILHRVEEVTEFMIKDGKEDIAKAETLQHVKRVEDTQERYIRLTTLLPIGVFHTDAEGEITYVNERWERIVGCVWSEVTEDHKKWYEYLPPNQRDIIEKNWHATCLAPFQAEYHAGGDMWYTAHLMPEISKLNNVKGYFGYIVDITERKLAEEVAKKRSEQLAELDRQKTMFFSNISHELRTPLTLILGPAEDSLSESGRQVLPPRQRERMEVIQRSAQRLLKLVNSSLDFTRLEEGRISTSFEPTDLSGFTDMLARLFKPAMESAGLTFHTDCTSISEPVYVDRDLWQKIVFNLLSNALKYTLKGSVSMTLRQEGDNVLLIVQDTGIGIAANELPNMFQRFYRVANADGRSHEGAGIGLSLTQQLVRLHGGKITVASEFHRGSIFTVSMPLGRAHLPADRIREQTAATVTNTPGMSAQLFVKEALSWVPENAATAASTSAATSFSFSTSHSAPSPALTSATRPYDASPPRFHVGTPPNTSFGPYSISPSNSSGNNFSSGSISPYAASSHREGSIKREQIEHAEGFKILIADDNADMRKLLRNLLSTEFSVTVVSDGEQAWKLTKAEKFDLIVSDLMMPKMDGFALVKALRADKKTQTLPVILLSARVDEESRLRGLHLGADDFIVKPFSKRELMERVGGRLRVGRWRHQLTKDLHEYQDESQRQKRLLQLVSHELRNPLVGIKGNSELVESLLENIETSLQDGNFVIDALLSKLSESRAAIRIVLQCTDYQKIVCDDVLDMAKLKDQKMELHLTSFDPSQIVKDAVKMLSVRAQQGEIKLTAECKMRQRIVSGDSTRLTQVLVNLISNAIKFTPKQGTITVALKAQSETAEKIELQFIVSDTGMGMSEEQQQKIFSPFTQASAAIASQFGGTGLGLSISKSLVELMGGHIKVTSQLGKGSTFTATVYCGNVFVSEVPKSAAKQIEQKKLVVMVVDDTIVNQRILKRMLEIAGHQCVVANNGQEGINMWSQMVKVDAILMDLNMPIMGGLEATQRIRQAERQKAEGTVTNIIGLSGDNSDTVAWKEAGMNDYVVKPYNQKDLLEKLQAATR